MHTTVYSGMSAASYKRTGWAGVVASGCVYGFSALILYTRLGLKCQSVLKQSNLQSKTFWNVDFSFLDLLPRVTSVPPVLCN